MSLIGYRIIKKMEVKERRFFFFLTGSFSEYHGTRNMIYKTRKKKKFAST